MIKPSERFRKQTPSRPLKQGRLQRFPPVFTTPTHSVNVYAVLHILLAMKKQVGLEAMLEYIEKYLQMIDRHNPDLQAAVQKALSLMSVEKIYREGVQ